jgi:hypothetical protein
MCGKGLLLCVLVEVQERLVGPGSKESVGLADDCSAVAAAGTRFLASVPFGQVVTRACKL